MHQPPNPARIPESLTPTEIGAHLRRLRQQLGLTPEEVSPRINLKARYIVAIEEANYDVMPGKVYARGFIQTYAEFLGLDADQVTAQCFAAPPTPVSEASSAAPRKEKDSASAKPSADSFSASRAASPQPRGSSRRWLVYLAIATVCGAFIWGGAHILPPEDKVLHNVAPVPDSLLSRMRSEVVPTAMNYPCLAQETVLGCFFAQHSMVEINRLRREAQKLYAEMIEPLPLTETGVNDAAD